MSEQTKYQNVFKYDLGDVVYFLNNNEVCYLRIRYIKTPYYTLGPSGKIKTHGEVLYGFGVDVMTEDNYLVQTPDGKTFTVPESKCFKSKGELLKSL